MQTTVILPPTSAEATRASTPDNNPDPVRDLPSDIDTFSTAHGDGIWAELLYEQRELPRATSQLGADLLLTGSGGAPLRSPAPMVAIAALNGLLHTRDVAGTLAQALGRAGIRGVITTWYPDDVPVPGADKHTHSYGPLVSRKFAIGGRQGTTDSYVLCHGFARPDLPLILAAWTFVEGSLGDTFPLIFAGGGEHLEREIISIAEDLDVANSVRIHNKVRYAELVDLYAAAAVYMAVSFPACGQAMRWALACGVPVVGLKTVFSDSLLGDAGYVVPPGDSRKLGAACLTALIQEPVAQTLREKGLQRASAYSSPEGVQGIMDHLVRAASVRPSKFRRK